MQQRKAEESVGGGKDRRADMRNEVKPVQCGEEADAQAPQRSNCSSPAPTC